MKLLIGIALMTGYLLASDLERDYKGSGKPFRTLKRRFNRLPFHVS